MRPTTTFPDIIIASAHLVIGARLEPTMILKSDHLPIIVSLNRWFSVPLQSLPISTSASQGEKTFRKVLPKAQTPPTQGSPSSITPSHPTLTLTYSTHGKLSCPPYPTAATPANSGRKEFNTLSGKRQHHDPDRAIACNNHIHIKPPKIDIYFCRQFTESIPKNSSPQTRSILKQIHKQHPIDHNTDTFTVSHVHEAIKYCNNSTTNSPDGLITLHLRHLGPLGLRYLCRLYNLS